MPSLAKQISLTALTLLLCAALGSAQTSSTLEARRQALKDLLAEQWEYRLRTSPLYASFLGDALLVPVTEVGSMASAFGWLATCVSFFLIERNLRSRVLTSLGVLVAVLLLVMKLVPTFPGHFTEAEWIALAIWLVLGASLHLRSSSSSSRTSANSASPR